jgi:glycosyltransferase involved in cell wall biosynthesis
MQSVISIVVLNWNRSDLLKETIDSYLNTVTVPYELFIIDNASADDSRELKAID